MTEQGLCIIYSDEMQKIDGVYTGIDIKKLNR
jgi:hypothetical protein